MEAANKYPKAREIEDVLFQLATLHYDNQNYEKALDVFNKYLLSYPNGIYKKNAILYRSYAYYELGEWQSAFNSMKNFISLYP